MKIRCVWLSRLQCRHVAAVEYQRRLLDACIGKDQLPKVRTFSKTEMHTSVLRDYDAAAMDEMYSIALYTCIL